MILLLGGPSDKLGQGGQIIPGLDSVVHLFRDQAHNLDIFLYLAVSWYSQTASIFRSAFNQLRLITQLCPYSDKGLLRTLVHALAISQINYCNAVYVVHPLRLTQRL